MPVSKLYRLVLVSLVLIVSGCQEEGPWQKPVVSSTSSESLSENKIDDTKQALSDSIDWDDITTGLSRGVFLYGNAKVAHEIIIYRLDQKYFTFEVHNDVTPQALKDWQVKKEGHIVVNGGYFHPDYTPSGMIVVDGEKINKRQFDSYRSGAVIVQNGHLQIADLAHSTAVLQEPMEYAIQSYPFYIKNGQPSITIDTKKKARRTVIGIDEHEMVYLMLVGSSDLSLFQLMEIISVMPVPFRHVLNLDGGRFSGLVADIDGHQEVVNGSSRVPNVLMVKKK